MTRDGFAFRLAEHVKTAATKQPSILGKRVTPHVLRHSCAMHTLAATGDIRKVALWLGHASIQSTETYLRADPEEKLQILAAHGAPAIKPGRFAAIRCPDHHAHRRSKASLARLRTPPGTHFIWSEIMENRRKPAHPAATLDVNCDCKEYVLDYLAHSFPVQLYERSPIVKAICRRARSIATASPSRAAKPSPAATS
jgi:hypothetical protein